MRTYGLAPWHLDDLTIRELELLERDVRALDKAAKAANAKRRGRG